MKKNSETLAQRIEQSTSNRQVEGSSPSGFAKNCTHNSAVECLPSMQNVESSNLSAYSNKWSAIDSAPKDGKWILLCRKRVNKKHSVSGHVDPDRYIIHLARWNEIKKYWRLYPWNSQDIPKTELTHWMPLPSPPEAT